jgi:hypothetical protein
LELTPLLIGLKYTNHTLTGEEFPENVKISESEQACDSRSGKDMLIYNSLTQIFLASLDHTGVPNE